MRILIMGAGIAGMVAALALQKAGLEPEIYEAEEEGGSPAHGAFLTVAVNGLDAMRAIGADAVVRTTGFALGDLVFFSGTGKRLGAVPIGPTLADGTVTYTVRRSDLHDGLRQQAARGGIRITHGKRLVNGVALPGGGVVARFGDGSTTRGDVLVGADGVHSVTRTIIDAANPAPRYTGVGNTGSFARPADVAARPGEYHLIWGRDCSFGYTVSPQREIWWLAHPPSPVEIPRAALRDTTAAQLRQRLVGLLAVDRTGGAAIVQASNGEFRLSNQYEMPTVPTWRNESMVIIGDAAHAVTPASGQGCSLATEDAVVLAMCLRDVSGIPAALSRYEQLRRPRVERAVAWASGFNNAKRRGPVGRTLRDLVLPVMLRRAARPRNLESMSWLFNHHIDWAESVS